MKVKGPRLRLPEGLKCPTSGCEAKISYHSECMWCNSCGWAKNRYPSPVEGYIERKVAL